jgi:hypothetical protein
MSTAPTSPHAIQRRRPTDGSGCFWSLVALVWGGFYCLIGGVWTIIGSLILLASPACLMWQFAKWRHDSAIERQAIEWCQTFYPSCNGVPIADFMVAVAHHANGSLAQVTPSTPLAELDWTGEEREGIRTCAKFVNRHSAWLSTIASQSRISKVDAQRFSGTTLADAIVFVAEQCKDG